MSNVKTNMRLEDMPAFIGMLMRRMIECGVSTTFSQEELDRQPDRFTVMVTFNSGAPGEEMEINYSEKDEDNE